MPDPVDAEVTTLFAEHKAQLSRYIRHFVGEDEAQDVLQDVFVAFLKQKRKDKVHSKDQLAWLYRASHNRAIDYLRRKKRFTRYSDEKFDRVEATNKNPELRTYQALRDDLFRIALGFDKKGEGPLLLQLLEMGTPKLQIARTLGMSDRNLRRRVGQLFQYLQQELRKHGIDKLDL